jgi:hypothetical protein
MTVLPDCIGRLSELQILDLSNNEITEIPAALASCSKLNTLLLDHNHLSTLPQEIASIPIPLLVIYDHEYGADDTTYSMDVSYNRLCSLPAEMESWLNPRADKSWRTTQDCSTAVMNRIPLSRVTPDDKSPFSISVSSGIAAIRFNVAENSMVRLSAFAPNGRLAARITEEYKSAGWYSLQWRIPAGFSAGVYFVTMTCNGKHAQMARVVIR